MRREAQRWTARVLALCTAFGTTVALPRPVAAAIQSVTITASADPSTLEYGQTTTLKATVTADGPADDGSSPYGEVKWMVATNPYYAQVASTTLASGETEVSVSGEKFQTGTHELWAVYQGSNPRYYNAVSEHFFITVGPASSTVTVTAPTTVEAFDLFNLQATVYSENYDGTGTLDFYRVGNPTPICTVGSTSQGTLWCTTSVTATGSYGYYAVYSGGPRATGSTSNTAIVTAGPNVVHASGVGVQYTTFNPVKDGYRDTVKIQGLRQELASVTIRIYNPAGSLIKTQSLAAGYNVYGWPWNGRRSDGTILPEGKYKIVQTLKDQFNATKAYTSYVTLSKKKLIWHSASITKNGSAFSASGKQGTGSVTVNTTSGWVRLRSTDPYTTWAGAGWQFTLATGVSYRSIAVQVYAKHGFSSGYQRMGSQDFAKCAYTATGEWSEGCFNTWKSLAGSNGVLAWTNTGTLTASHRSGTKVRSMVSVASGDVYVYKARVTYQYATLGY